MVLKGLRTRQDKDKTMKRDAWRRLITNKRLPFPLRRFLRPQRQLAGCSDSFSF
ncbi:hypothetical protein E2C01_006832 [Portunus trituberculatus]|uniref:Uncharacterized protein n=1 Tax=Portunus trituberculatus TaxID=210409 RepID=A0A5B7D0Q8_PORTR|nr:hypothetical protein [Portunus trituberculatus]